MQDHNNILFKNIISYLITKSRVENQNKTSAVLKIYATNRIGAWRYKLGVNFIKRLWKV